MTEPKFRGDEPGVNWLAHVLIKNVGKNEWVPRTPEEQEAHRQKMEEWGLPETEQDYPYKVVTHPIPEGAVMRFECSQGYVIACDNPDIREYLVGIAERMEWFRSEYYRLARDVSPWRLASEHPDAPYSSIRHRILQVDSSALRYIGSFFVGYHDYEQDAWFVLINGKPIKHQIERWRPLPRAPGETAAYDSVQAEVERLKQEAGLKQ